MADPITTTANASPAGMFSSFLWPLAAMFGIFYFLVMRPQQKQQKKFKEMLASIKKGDRVVTRGGIHGMIQGIADDIITVEIADNIRVKFSRDAISGVTPASS